jgi:hypothetical protein
MRRTSIAFTGFVLLIGIPADADVTISSGATQNMSCSNGVCAPTSKSAVLNVGDLESLLVSGNIEVTTTGSGIQADNIVIKARLAWSSSNTLALDAYQSIIVDKPVSIAGLSGLTLTTNDGGTNGVLSFGSKGNVTFANLSSSLTINGNPYKLAGDIKTLVTEIDTGSGYYALVSSYDAKPDGTYTSAPIQGLFGTFEGLGNTISNLAVNDTTANHFVGFIGTAEQSSEIRDIGLANAKVSGRSDANVGALVGGGEGTVAGSHASGSVSATGDFAAVGGLVGGLVIGEAVINNSYSTASVTGGSKSYAGGLVGAGGGTIMQSYATGNVKGKIAGGLVGAFDLGSVSNCYATGAVTGRTRAYVGGLVGEANSQATISTSYATGAILGAKNRFAGGVLGSNDGQTDALYWDTTTSGTDQGVGSGSGDTTGLTTAQFQSGLPAGFDPSVWSEKPNINGGFPYLLANPPN